MFSRKRTPPHPTWRDNKREPSHRVRPRVHTASAVSNRRTITDGPTHKNREKPVFIGMGVTDCILRFKAAGGVPLPALGWGGVVSKITERRS